MAHQVITRIEIHLTSGFGLPKLLPNFKQLPKLHVYLFKKLTRIYDNKKAPIRGLIKDSEHKYVVQPGLFLRDLIIWCAMILLLYFIKRITLNKK